MLTDPTGLVATAANGQGCQGSDAIGGALDKLQIDRGGFCDAGMAFTNELSNFAGGLVDGVAPKSWSDAYNASICTTRGGAFYNAGKAITFIDSLVLGEGAAASALKGLPAFSRALEGEPELTRVGRWMGDEEHQAMLETGMVQEGGGGTTFVAHPADLSSYMGPAKPGTRYIEFDVPRSSVSTPSSKEGYAQVVGPNSVLGRLASHTGQTVPQLPPAVNIEWIASKL